MVRSVDDWGGGTGVFDQLASYRIILRQNDQVGQSDQVGQIDQVGQNDQVGQLDLVGQSD